MILLPNITDTFSANINLRNWTWESGEWLDESKWRRPQVEDGAPSKPLYRSLHNICAYLTSVLQIERGLHLGEAIDLVYIVHTQLWVCSQKKEKSWKYCFPWNKDIKRGKMQAVKEKLNEMSTMRKAKADARAEEKVELISLSTTELELSAGNSFILFSSSKLCRQRRSWPKLE